MLCTHCGKDIDDNSTFCRYCGKTVTDSAYEPNHQKNPAQSPLLLAVLCNISLVIFLILNIKMAPFHGSAKVIAYLAEGIAAVYLTQLAKRKLSHHPSPRLIRTVIAICSVVILISFGLRIVYNVKVDAAEKDFPRSGTILVEIDESTSYHASQHFISHPNTTVKINGSKKNAALQLGEPVELMIKCSGRNIGSGYIQEAITLDADDFTNDCSATLSKTVTISKYTAATVTVTLKRYCSFWSVIFH